MLEQLSKDYAGKVDIVGMNVDVSPDTASTLGIMAIPAIIFFKDGREVAREGKTTVPVREISAPNGASVHLPPDFRPDFSLPPGSGRVRAIEIIPNQLFTRHVTAEPSPELNKMAVIDRHSGRGGLGLGFVRGLGLKRGAVASTIAHDSHNIVVAGTNDDDMRAAVAEIARMGGGQVVVAGGEPIAMLALPIAGLVSDRPLEEVAPAAERVRAATHELGSPLHDPFMTLAFLALPVIPELRLTDRGLVDVEKMEIVPLYA